jgi:hypothetical protein
MDEIAKNVRKLVEEATEVNGPAAVLVQLRFLCIDHAEDCRNVFNNERQAKTWTELADILREALDKAYKLPGLQSTENP